MMKSMKKMQLLVPITLFAMTALVGCNNSEGVDASTLPKATTSTTPNSTTTVASAKVQEMSQANLLSWQEAEESAYTLIDVRTPEEFASGHITGAINIPHDQILNDTTIMSKYTDGPVVIYCRSGARAGKVSELLEQKNLSDNVYHLSGDILGWNEAKLPLVTE